MHKDRTPKIVNHEKLSTFKKEKRSNTNFLAPDNSESDHFT